LGFYPSCPSPRLRRRIASLAARHARSLDPFRPKSSRALRSVVVRSPSSRSRPVRAACVSRVPSDRSRPVHSTRHASFLSWGSQRTSLHRQTLQMSTPTRRKRCASVEVLPDPQHVPSLPFLTTSTVFSIWVERACCVPLPILGFIRFQVVSAPWTRRDTEVPLLAHATNPSKLVSCVSRSVFSPIAVRGDVCCPVPTEVLVRPVWLLAAEAASARPVRVHATPPRCRGDLVSRDLQRRDVRIPVLPAEAGATFHRPSSTPPTSSRAPHRSE